MLTLFVQLIALETTRNENLNHRRRLSALLDSLSKNCATRDEGARRRERIFSLLSDLTSCAESALELFGSDVKSFDSVYVSRAVAFWRQVASSDDKSDMQSLLENLAEFSSKVFDAQGSHQVHMDACFDRLNALEKLLRRTPRHVRPLKSLPDSLREKMTASLQSILLRMLNGLQQAKKRLEPASSSEKPPPAFKSAERMAGALEAMRLRERTDELSDLVSAKENLERLGFDATAHASHLLGEARPIVFNCLSSAGAVLDACGQLSDGASSFAFSELRLLTDFCSHEFANDEENQEDGQGKEEDNLEGCGLGEGKGDKATTEGVESEDLFENQVDENEKEEQEQEENGDEKNDDHVDFSQKMDGENKDLDDKEGDDESDEDDKDDEEDAGPEDIEEDKANDEELKPEDWGEEEEEEKEDKGEQEQSDSASAKQEERQGQEQQEQPQEAREEEEKRERKPDDQTGADIENQEDDNYHNPDFKEEEIEDLDMGDDGNLDGDEGENEDGEEEMEQVRLLVTASESALLTQTSVQEEAPRLPDFVDEEMEDKPEEEENDEVETVDQVSGEMGENRDEEKQKSDGLGLGEADDEEAKMEQTENKEGSGEDNKKEKIGTDGKGKPEEEELKNENEDTEMKDEEDKAELKAKIDDLAEGGLKLCLNAIY